MFHAAGVATPGTPFRAVERLENLGRPQAALAVLQARQGSSSGALPTSEGLEAAQVGVRLLLRCGLLPEAYAEVGQAAYWQLHLGKDVHSNFKALSICKCPCA